MTSKLVIPLPLITLNDYIRLERSNRYAAAKAKKNCTNKVFHHAKQAKEQGLVIDTPFRARFEWYVKDRRKDLDNIAFQKKFVFDGMIKAKLIENDGYKQHRQSEDIYLIDKNERVEVYFEKLEEVE